MFVRIVVYFVFKPVTRAAAAGCFFASSRWLDATRVISATSRQAALRLTQPPLQLTISCIIAPFVPQSGDYGAPGAAYDTRETPTRFAIERQLCIVSGL